MSSGEESAAAIATGERPKAASRARNVAAMTVAHPAGRRCRNGNDDDDDVCSAVAMYGRCCSHAVAGLQLRLRAESTAGCCPVGVLECI